MLAGGRASVKKGVSLGGVFRDFQGHVVPLAAHGATQRSRDRRVQSLFTLGRETSQSAQSGSDAGQQTPGRLPYNRIIINIDIILLCLWV